MVWCEVKGQNSSFPHMDVNLTWCHLFNHLSPLMCITKFLIKVSIYSCLFPCSLFCSMYFSFYRQSHSFNYYSFIISLYIWEYLLWSTSGNIYYFCFSFSRKRIALGMSWHFQMNFRINLSIPQAYLLKFLSGLHGIYI